MLLSAGELNENKNHQIIIRALAKLNNPKVHYAIAGEGEKKEYLIGLANELGVSEQVHLLGYRKDMPELNHTADVFCFPSIREGLPVSPIEAMACGLPIIAGDNRGTRDLFVNEESGGILFSPNNVDECYQAIVDILNGDKSGMGRFNRDSVKKYSISNILIEMKSIYENWIVNEINTHQRFKRIAG